jgi:predicted O-methyltransferase YrrM
MAAIQRLTYREVRHGHVPNEECQVLQDHAAGKVCLEIGSWYGRSTVAMAETASHIYTIDTFKGLPPAQDQSDVFTSLEGFLKYTAGYNNISVMIGRSQDLVPAMRDESVDMVFIDGSHDYQSVKADAVNSLRVLKPGGEMFFHDYYPDSYPGVKKSVSELFCGINGSLGMLAWTIKEMKL